ncbi:redoxin domain-containing protein [Streptomyces sp. NRRL S-1022]|uniref:redoxin domain-containing protein n=1 Tax=Streptomyces sp. NRRL S-1022 TaxID=1463880 RepID=UPI0004C23407|nr:redoxin domain-containing protein [Streptomyces sp. NRRL S-1022]
MVYLAAALVAVAALCTWDLMLTLAVLRRLRDRPDGTLADDTGGLPVGATVGTFATHCVAGPPITERDLTDGALVAFFTTGCLPCRSKLPRFVEEAKAMSGHRQVVAVVVSPNATPDDKAEAEFMVSQLKPVATVLSEDPEGPCTSAFGVTAYPCQFAVSARSGTAPTVLAVGNAALTTSPAGST